MCPQCGGLSHLSVGDHQEWYEKYFPGVPFGRVVPGICFSCFQGIEKGQIVVLRNLRRNQEGIADGDIGTVREIVESKDGPLYDVQLNGDRLVTLIRSEIRRAHSRDGRPVGAENERGGTEDS